MTSKESSSSAHFRIIESKQRLRYPSEFHDKIMNDIIANRSNVGFSNLLVLPPKSPAFIPYSFKTLNPPILYSTWQPDCDFTFMPRSLGDYLFSNKFYIFKSHDLVFFIKKDPQFIKQLTLDINSYREKRISGGVK